jgi:hypothetical protein
MTVRDMIVLSQQRQGRDGNANPVFGKIKTRSRRVSRARQIIKTFLHLGSTRT